MCAWQKASYLSVSHLRGLPPSPALATATIVNIFNGVFLVEFTVITEDLNFVFFFFRMEGSLWIYGEAGVDGRPNDRKARR